MMCRHQNNTIFLMGLDPDYCAHCEVERVRRLLVSLWKHQSGDMPINKNGELWREIQDAAKTDTSASPLQTQSSQP